MLRPTRDGNEHAGRHRQSPTTSLHSRERGALLTPRASNILDLPFSSLPQAWGDCSVTVRHLFNGDSNNRAGSLLDVTLPVLARETMSFREVSFAAKIACVVQ